MKVSSIISTQVLSNSVPHSDMGHVMWEPRGSTEGLGVAEKVPDYFKEFSILKSMLVRSRLGFEIFSFT